MDEHPSSILSAYVDGALLPEQATEVAAHLAECEHCRTVVDDLQDLRTLLRSVDQPSPHPSLLPRTLARLDARRQRRTVAARWRLAVAAGAVVAALALWWPVVPTPSAEHGTSVWDFQRHAEMTLTHSMIELSLASYLSTSLPYRPLEEGPGSR